MKKTFALLTLLVAFLPSVVMAQTAKTAEPKPSVKLAFADDETEMEITDSVSGALLTVTEGMTIPVGAILKTKATTAELQLLPNKSIIKLSANTNFQIKELKDGATGKNDFYLAAGKVRAVAAKLTGATTKDPGYTISTKTANCGVRGTDFAMLYDEAAQKDWVCVQEGLVDFTNVATGATVPVAKGQFANTFDPVFSAAVLSAEQLADLFSDVEFVVLSPLDVPGKEVAQVAQEAPAAVEEAPAAAEEKKPEAPAADDPMMEMLKKLFGLEVGSITIRGTTYSKAVMSPVVAFDGFKLGLYLPIVYTSDMFNPNDWYRPAGNNEWSFGTDKKGLWNKTADAVNDFVLKIKYLEIGTQGADPFYLKLGNLKTMSLGHGSVVRNFANDQDFPAVRKVGLNAGVKLGPLALEGMADDVAQASVAGGRLALDLIGDQVAVGVQAAADLNLADDQDLAALGKTAASYGDPILLVGGLDLQLFKINAGGVFRTTAFADANTMAVYYRQVPANGLVDQGLNLTPFMHEGTLGSFGGESGIFGNILLVDYRLTFQAEKGLYTNGIFQGNYYRTRGSLLTKVTDYVEGSEANRTTIDENLNMGVFGSFGFDIGLLSLEGAYRWPFELKADGSIGPSKADSLKIKVDIPKDKIPFVALSGGISYERTEFVNSLVKGTDLFDANTVFKGEVVYGLAKGMDLVIGVGTMTQRDTDGSVVYQDGKPKVSPSVSLDTKLSL